MKKYYVLLFVLLITNIEQLSAQESHLYDTEGYLKADNEYKINPDILGYVASIEKHILYEIYKEVYYPETGYRNGIQGIVIAEIVFSTETKNLTFRIVKTPDPCFKETVINAIKKSTTLLLNSFEFEKYENSERIFIPFDFVLRTTEFYDSLEENSAIKIEKDFYTKPIWLYH